MERQGGNSSSQLPVPSSTSNNSSSTSTSSNQQWRNPTIQQQQKYNLRPLPSSFVPTKAEQQLLDMYEVLRSYERTAARIKEETARAKLLARDAEFQQSQQQQQQQNLTTKSSTTALTESNNPRKTNKRQRKVKKSTKSGEDYNNDNDDDDDDDAEDDDDDDDSDVMSDDYDDDNDNEDEQKTKHERREAKLAALREEIDEKKKTMTATAAEDIELREQYLAVASETLDDGPMLKKKQRKDISTTAYGDNTQQQQPSSLLTANMTGTITPPHDFSQTLQLSTSRGRVLFPDTKVHDVFVWSPPTDVSDFNSPNDGALELVLNDFDIQLAQSGSGNNTIAIKCSIPSDSKRFSINIAGPSHEGYQSVLFHFNPRRERGGQLIVNDKQYGNWGHALSIPLSQLPLMFGQTSCTILIQINGEGYDMFVENVHCARLEHRSELPVGVTNLMLQFPSTDDYLKPENWTVYKVWWGNRPILAKGDVSNIPGVNSFSSEHPRKIFIGNLPRLHTEAEVEIRRAELERAFQKYGGDRGVQVIAPTNKTFAFVEMESEHMTDLALRELNSMYQMNRARRSRHEALREERAAAAASGDTTGAIKKGTGWD